MGSGCNPNKINNPLDLLSSDQVIYQGSPEPSLNICTGDTITEVEQALINKLKNLTADGKDITLSTLVLDVCADIKNLLGDNAETVTNVIQAIVQYSCVLKSRLDVLNNIVVGSTGTGTINFGCLTAPTNPNLTNSLQTVIDSLCTLQAQVNQILASSGSTTIIDNRINSALNSLITWTGNYGVKKTINPTTSQPTYNFTGLVPPKTGLPYFGALSNFDSSGKGIAGLMDGWYLCNGLNGTPDMRGFVPVGAINGVPGATINALVDPSSDATMNYNVGTPGGHTKLTLINDNIPAHTHPVNDPGHNHPNFYHPFVRDVKGGGNNDIIFEDADKTYNKSNPVDPGKPFIGTATTGITIGTNTTGGLPIDIRQPYLPCHFIMRFD